MSEIEALQKRVESLEKDRLKIVECMAEHGSLQSRNQTIRDAYFDALLTVVRELAEHEGISHEAFQKHFDTAYAHALHRHLGKIEDISPSHAAEIDTRTKDEILPDDLAPLFDPPEHGNET